jgi:dipeptidyl aminopeptidase/acylaminoacyl peptidase
MRMPDVREVYEMVTKEKPSEPGALERQHTRQIRTARNRKVAAAAVAAAVLVALAIVALNVVEEPEPNVGTAPSPPTAQPPLGPQIIGVEGGTLFEVPGLPRDAHWLTPSPDGQTIAFRTRSDGRFQVATIGVDGSKMRILTSGGYRSFDQYRIGQLSWSRDGRRIAYSEYDDIYVMDADGSNVERVTATSGGEYGPAFSPDGSKIAFWRGSPHGEHTVLCMVDLETGRIRTVKVGAGLFPDWSATGWISYDGEGGGVYKVRPDGSDAQFVTEGGSGRWSPDGTKLSFQVLRVQGSGDYDQTPDGQALLELQVLHVETGYVATPPVRFASEWNMATWVSNDTLLINRYD